MRAQVLLRVPLVGAVAHSQSLSELASNVMLAKQALPLRQFAETAQKENSVSSIQEQESALPVLQVSFNQRRRPPRRAHVVRLDGRKRARENPRAKILAAPKNQQIASQKVSTSTIRVTTKQNGPAKNVHLEWTARNPVASLRSPCRPLDIGMPRG